MTQPRSQQIKSVNARYSVLQFQAVPAASSATMSPGDFPYAPGGSAEAVPARVLGNVIAPFPVLGGDTLAIGIDGAPPQNVVFAATDTTAGRVSLKINAVVGAAVASNEAGYLSIVSPTSGKDSEIELVEVTPGILAKFGLLAGKFYGQDADVGGLVTKSADGLGGIAPLATIDGKNIVTDGGKLLYVMHASPGQGRKLAQLEPGGVPITGRVTFDGTNVVVSYYARMIPRRTVRSTGSFFSQLGGGDGVTPVATVYVNGNSVALHFPNAVGSYTRDDVVNVINAAWHNGAPLGGVTDPWARVDGTVAGPFLGLSQLLLGIQVDGGSQQGVYFTTESTLDEVIAAINGQVTGVTAFKTPNVSTGPYLAIRSNNSNPVTSSLRIYAGGAVNGDENDGGALAALGLRAGYYGGSYICQPYGPDEIEIVSALRGASVGIDGSINFGGNTGTLAKLGLTVGTYPAYTEPQYVPVPSPSMTANEGLEQPYKLLMAYPSVLEFGEVPGDADVAIQQYAAKSAGSNVADIGRYIYVHQDGRIGAASTSRGFFDVGKPIVMSPEGALSADAGGSSQAQIEAIIAALAAESSLLSQIIRTQPSTIVQAVVGTKFETPGNGNNPGAASGFMSLYSDPTASFSERGVRIFNDPGVPAFAVEDDTAASPLAKAYFAAVYQGRSLWFAESEGRLADQNTVASGDDDGWIRLTSGANQEDYLSVGGKPATDDVNGYNLMRSVNARYEIYVGDGSSSFGDFSGQNALTQARDWCAARGIIRCRIIVKPGVYVETTNCSFNGFSDVAIEGLFPCDDVGSSVTINWNFVGDCITATAALISFKLKNVKIIHSNPTQQTLNVSAYDVDVEGCVFNTPVSFTSPQTARFHKCINTATFTSGLGGISLRLTYTDAVTNGAAYANVFVSITQCQFSSGSNKPCIKVLDSLTLKQVQFRKFLIQDSVFFTGNLSTNGSNVINSSDGVGILSIVPTHNSYLDPAGFASRYTPGFVVEDLTIQDVDIIGGTASPSAGSGPAGLYLTPSGINGGLVYSYYNSTSDGWAVSLVGVTLKNVSMDCVAQNTNPPDPATGQFYLNGVKTPPIVVAGVGIPTYRSPTFGYGVHRGGVLEVDNLYLRMNNAPGGFGPPNLAPWLGTWYVTADAYDSQTAGHICFAGQTMDLKNITVDGSLGVCINSTLLLATYGSLSLDGFVEEPIPLFGATTGAQAAPQDRVIIREVFRSSMDLKNIFMDGGFDTASANQPWWQDAAIVFEAMDCKYKDRRLSNFTISGFRSVSTSSSIKLQTVGIGRCLFTGTGGGITIEDGYIGMYGSGINACYVGILAVANSTQKIGNLVIRNVAIDSHPSHGISLFTGYQDQNVVVEKCDIRLCGNSQIGSGLRSVTSRQAYVGNLIVRDNVVQYCNTFSNPGYYRVQVNIRNTVSTFQNLVSFYGNQSYTDDFSLGYANITYTANINLFAVSPTSSSIVPKGAETGYTGQTGSYATTGAGKIWIDGAGMIHNYFCLRSDINNTD